MNWRTFSASPRRKLLESSCRASKSPGRESLCKMYSERLITAASKWWGNTLRSKPKHHILGPNDSNVLDQAAVDVFSALLPKVPENKVRVFETELVFTIRAKI